MSQLGTVYATKRRRRNGKSLKPPPKDGVTKSNPSKRHRERLNAELDLLASLLPFEQNILSKLDRLSILRLSVSYLRTKSYFQVVMHKDKEENGILPHIHAHDSYRSRELGAFEHGVLDGDMFLQALNGFLMILTCDGEVFFATHSIESYLGFHQSDIVHQSVYELVHSEDREELQRQLLWNSFLPADMSTMQLSEVLAPDKSLYLERSFTVRFRCLLDNTSGFLRLDIRGRIKILHGQNRKTEEPPLALFAYCTPFGPPSLLEIPHKENMFKSKHKLDFSLVSMDQRGKQVLGYSDAELVNMGGYDMVHYDDLAYVASAHQELLKTGASGMIAYRYQKKSGEWQWLQTSSRLVYKNSKPDFVICTHRQLMDEEGHDLLGKRTMDFKVSYLDTGLASTYFSEADQLVVPPSSSPNSLPPPVTPTRPNRRYKTQLRDFLSTCRTKRKMQQPTSQQTSPLGQVSSPVAPVVEYLPDPAVAVAAAYSNLGTPMYATSPYASAYDMGPSVHSSNFYPVTENLFHQYRLQGVGGYYTDYHHSGAPTAASAYVTTNGFLSYDGYAIASSKDDKWQQETGKYYSGYSSGYGSPTSTAQVSLKTPKSSPHVMEAVSCSSDGPSPVGGGASAAGQGSRVVASANAALNGGAAGVTPKVEMTPQDPYERQTVLMWGSQSSGVPISGSVGSSGRSTADRPPSTSPLTNGLGYSNNNNSNNNNNNNENDVSVSAKWNGNASSVPASVTVAASVSKDNKSLTTPSATPDSSSGYHLPTHDDSGLYSTSSSHTTSPQQQQQQQQRLGVGSSGGGGGGLSNVAASTDHHQHNSSSNNSNNNATAIPIATTTPHHHPHHHHADPLVLHSSATHSPPVPPPATSHMHHALAGTTTSGHLHHHHHVPTSAIHHDHSAASVSLNQLSHHSHHHAHHATHHASSHPHHTPHHGHSHAHTPTASSLGHHHGHHHHHHPTNGEIIFGQHSRQHQLTYANQLPALTGCTSTPSSSSSPSCTSPNSAGHSGVNQQHQPLPSIGNVAVINGNATLTAAPTSTSTATASASPYHQVAIIASPIVITADDGPQPSIGDSCPVSSASASSASVHQLCHSVGGGNRLRQRSGSSGHHHHLIEAAVSYQNHHHHHGQQHLMHPMAVSPTNSTASTASATAAATAAAIANITAHTAFAYAPNAYIIGGVESAIGPTGDHQPDGSPLLSFSEVTNTLLNQ